MKTVGAGNRRGLALQIYDVVEPHAGPGQVRIRVHAAAVDPGERYVHSSVAGRTCGKPCALGVEAAGVLDEVGDGVSSDLRVGDRVMAATLPALSGGGAYAQYLCLPADWVTRAPVGMSHAQAAVLPLSGLAARQALDLIGLNAGQSVAVTGSAGVVGGYVVQMAKADGLTVVADPGPADEDLVRSLGADLIVPRGAHFGRRVRWTVPDGVDGVVDTAGLPSAAIAPALRDGGSIALLHGHSLHSISAAERRLRSLDIHAVYVPDYLGDPGRLSRLRLQAEAGELTPRVAQTFPAEQAGEAHHLMETGAVRGRLVLEF
ncbi:NADP-dependent oxidoreductase [Streptomyces sp. NPDC048512]|uniref:NADP-dependent oxidoreductase n=1 Tax=Streptomyces sp. NPDC048512 TaxID=3365563 RepID=UPI00372218BE